MFSDKLNGNNSALSTCAVHTILHLANLADWDMNYPQVHAYHQVIPVIPATFLSGENV
jgi:hypothetical protein